jgi:YcxB-like protein
MHLDYEITEEDFVDGQRLAIKNSSFRSVRWTLYVLPAFGVFLLLDLIYFGARQGISLRQVPGLAFGLFFSLFMLSLPLRSKRTQRKMYAKSTSMHGPLSLDVDDEGIRFSGRTFSSNVSWDLFGKFFEDGKTFVLYQKNERIFNIVPKRGLTTEQTTALRQYFELRLRSMAKS